jgi:hypothetical protein
MPKYSDAQGETIQSLAANRHKGKLCPRKKKACTALRVRAVGVKRVDWRRFQVHASRPLYVNAWLGHRCPAWAYLLAESQVLQAVRGHDAAVKTQLHKLEVLLQAALTAGRTYNIG